MIQLDSYLGIAYGLDDPFNLFINMTDIQENMDLIYFFSYSMLKKNNKTLDITDVQAGCKFTTLKYISYINIWQEMNYRIYTTLTKIESHPA